MKVSAAGVCVCVCFCIVFCDAAFEIIGKAPAQLSGEIVNRSNLCVYLLFTGVCVFIFQRMDMQKDEKISSPRCAPHLKKVGKRYGMHTWDHVRHHSNSSRQSFSFTSCLWKLPPPASRGLYLDMNGPT